MATVNKDFRIKSGLVVEGANATVNGEDIITTGSSTDNLPEGANNLYFTEARAAAAVADEISTAVSTAVNALTTTDIEEGTNLYFTNQRALDATASAYDAAGAASAAQTAAENYADSAAQAAVTLANAYADSLAPNYDPAGSATTAENNAKSYADGLAVNYDPAGAAATAEQNANDYTDTAIGNLPAAFITSTTSEFSVNAGELSLDQLNGSTQINPASGLQPNNGYATIEYTDTDSGTEGLKIKSERGWVGSQIGGQLDVDAYRDVVITSRNGNIVLNADGDTYLGSVGAGNDVATTGYVNGLASNYDPAGSAATAEANANAYTDTAVANLVDGAPALLDTLNELAAAIADNPNYATDVANLVAGKQDTLTAGANISIVADIISVTGLDSADISDFNTAALSATASAYDVAGAAATAEQNAKDYADLNFVNVTDLPGQLDDYVPLTQKGVANGVATLDANGFVPASQLDIDVTGDISTAINALTTDDIEEGSTNLYFTDARAIDAVSGADIYPNAVILNNLSKQVAATADVAMLGTVTVLSWSKTAYKTAKLIVKATDGGNSHASEVMLTLDGSGNVAITEYGIVYTDAEMISVTADVSGSDVRVRVTTLTPTVTLTAVGTLLA